MGSHLPGIMHNLWEDMVEYAEWERRGKSVRRVRGERVEERGERRGRAEEIVAEEDSRGGAWATSGRILFILAEQ